MAPGATLVPRDSPVYRGFERLYRLAQALRPINVDRWNGELYATEGDSWGGFDPATGRISVSGDLVLRHLECSGQVTSPEDQAQALATILHEATHAGMPTDAPDEPNAVRSEHSLGVMEGFAEVRALDDFHAFALRAGYTGLRLPKPQYPAAHAAVEDLLKQASGPRKPWEALIDEGTRGPGAMHFDQLADGVLRNRLHDVVPDRAEDRLAVRAALIETMMHRGWILLKELDSAETGREVARNIRSKLDGKVEEIRRHYRATPGRVFPAEGANAEVVRVAEGNKLAALPPPAVGDRVERAAPGGETPQASARDGRGPGGVIELEVRGSGGRAHEQGTDGRPQEQGTGGGSAAPESGRGLAVSRASGGWHERGSDGSQEQDAGGRAHEQGTGGRPHEQGTGGRPHEQGTGGRPHEQGTGGRAHEQGTGGRPHEQGTGGRPHEQGTGGQPHEQGTGGRPHEQGTGGQPHEQGRGGGSAAPEPGNGLAVSRASGGWWDRGSDGGQERSSEGGPHEQGLGGGAAERGAAGGIAGRAAGGPEVRESAGRPDGRESAGRPDGRGLGRGAEERGAGGGSEERGAGGGVEMRFLEGQASAAGAVGWRPRLGRGERGAAGQDAGAGAKGVVVPER